jgi:hypothetical protein
MEESRLQDGFVAAAVDHGRHTEAGESRLTNSAHDRLMKILAELRKLPDRGQRVLSELLGHQDPSVRTWAATYLLPYREPRAVDALESVGAGTGLVALGSRMVLQEWRAGRLRLIHP